MEKSNPISYFDVFYLRSIKKGMNTKDSVNEALDESYKLQNNDDFVNFNSAEIFNLICELQDLKKRVGV